MKFYKMLAENYTKIFPFSEETFRLIKDMTPAGGNILDIGSAAGEYVKNLNGSGFFCAGLEYSPCLIKHREITAAGDMTYLPFRPVFDTVMCIGNTLAHAINISHAKAILSEIYRVLKPGGRALVQILNYDRILALKPGELPQINTRDCRFIRKYSYIDKKIRFTGILSCGDTVSKSSVSLYPITSAELLRISLSAGFNQALFFGSFGMDAFIPESSFPLIAILKK